MLKKVNNLVNRVNDAGNKAERLYQKYQKFLILLQINQKKLLISL